jgi:hypothetical protein
VTRPLPQQHRRPLSPPTRSRCALHQEPKSREIPRQPFGADAGRGLFGNDDPSASGFRIGDSLACMLVRGPGHPVLSALRRLWSPWRFRRHSRSNPNGRSIQPTSDGRRSESHKERQPNSHRDSSRAWQESCRFGREIARALHRPRTRRAIDPHWRGRGPHVGTDVHYRWLAFHS